MFRVRINLELTDEKLQAIVREAMKRGFLLENPRRTMTERDYKQAVLHTVVSLLGDIT